MIFQLSIVQHIYWPWFRYIKSYNWKIIFRSEKCVGFACLVPLTDPTCMRMAPIYADNVIIAKQLIKVIPIIIYYLSTIILLFQFFISAEWSETDFLVHHLRLLISVGLPHFVHLFQEYQPSFRWSFFCRKIIETKRWLYIYSSFVFQGLLPALPEPCHVIQIRRQSEQDTRLVDILQNVHSNKCEYVRMENVEDVSCIGRYHSKL